jgi:hypothetical protein
MAIQHPTIDWSTVSGRGTAQRVQVTCPECSKPRMVLTASIRSAARRHKFTGRCHAHRPRPATDTPVHPAVVWRDAGADRVPVQCPKCPAPRLLEAKSIRYLLKTGRFSPYCMRHRSLSRPKPRRDPQHPAVDWSNAVTIPAGAEPGRNRRTVPVRCPLCGEARLLGAKYVAARIRAGAFTAECQRDAARTPHRELAAETHKAVRQTLTELLVGAAKEQSLEAPRRDRLWTRIARRLEAQAS